MLKKFHADNEISSAEPKNQFGILQFFLFRKPLFGTNFSLRLTLRMCTSSISMAVIGIIKIISLIFIPFVVRFNNQKWFATRVGSNNWC